jgi:glucan-binding YG repeat protein
MLDKWVRVKGRWYHLLTRAGDDGATLHEGG